MPELGELAANNSPPLYKLCKKKIMCNPGTLPLTDATWRDLSQLSHAPFGVDLFWSKQEKRRAWRSSSRFDQVAMKKYNGWLHKIPNCSTLMPLRWFCWLPHPMRWFPTVPLASNSTPVRLYTIAINIVTNLLFCARMRPFQPWTGKHEASSPPPPPPPKAMVAPWC